MTQAPRYCTRCGGRLARDNRDARCAARNHAAPDTLLRPPTVPREFWDTDQMRDALATWHIGRVFFAYRMHPYHGRPLSQETIGSWLGLTQAQLSRIENGRAPEELTKLVRYAQILGIPGDLLWFSLPEQRQDSLSVQPGPALTLNLSAIVNGRPVLLPIDAATARANGLDDLLSELGVSSQSGEAGNGTPRRLNLRTPNALTSLGLDELEHVAAALNDARRYLDGSVVGYFGQQLGCCKADDGNLGPAKAFPWCWASWVRSRSTLAKSSPMSAAACFHLVPTAPSSPVGSTAICKTRRARPTGMTAPWSGHRKRVTPRCRATYC